MDFRLELNILILVRLDMLDDLQTGLSWAKVWRALLMWLATFVNYTAQLAEGLHTSNLV